MDKIRNGEWGPEMQELVEGIQFVTIDLEGEWYYCPKCGDIKYMQTFDLYQPKDIEVVKKLEKLDSDGAWTTLGCLGEWPYWERSYGFQKLLKKYIHVCDCGCAMKKANFKKMGMPNGCPECHQPWDKVGSDYFDEFSPNYCQKCGRYN